MTAEEQISEVQSISTHTPRAGSDYVLRLTL